MNTDTTRFIEEVKWLSRIGKERWHKTLSDIRNLPEVPVNSR